MKSNSIAILVAVIALCGTLGAALISNWDKIFGPAPDDSTEPPIVTPDSRPPELRTVTLPAKALSIDLPEWSSDPPRGSITFNKDAEIAQSRELTVHLDIRDQGSGRWAQSEPVLVLSFRPGERLCSIVPADHNTAGYFLGLQAHCAVRKGCSYNMEGRRLWATMDGIQVVLAPEGVECP